MASINFLDQFCTVEDENLIGISAAQGSDFAKQVALDFNPIHDVDSKRFCVPGDLLFAVALSRYGLRQKMYFSFDDLVKADTHLDYPVSANEEQQSLTVSDVTGKPVLGMQFSGQRSDDQDRIEQLVRQYVAFSGQNFPHILVPLMEQHQVMINPKRPLVIYQKMFFELDTVEFENLNIKLEQTSLEVDGRRGTAKLHFSLSSDGRQIGSGTKYLVLSGLREYQQDAIDVLCSDYMHRVETMSV